jgi:phosphatidylglycerophosphatase A
MNVLAGSLIATLGPVGYMVMPGTLATLITIPLIHLLQAHLDYFQYAVFILLFGIFTWLIIRSVLLHTKCGEDPAEIVIDEVFGCLITFFGIPLSQPSLLVGVILFRFFSILKVGGVAYAESLQGVNGIVLDDIVAGIIACSVLRLLFL